MSTNKYHKLKGIWITWEFQRRNIGISRALGLPLYQFDIKKNRISRYIKCVLATYQTIKREKPCFVIAQNPSILLAIIVILMHRWQGFHPIIDAHNSGIFPLEGKSVFLQFIARWLQKQAHLTIVTNIFLQNIVKKNGGEAFILPDAIPQLPLELDLIQLKGKINFTCICTYGADEPYKEIISATRLLPNDIHIYITGKFEGKISLLDLPSNVHLTGYLPEKDYWSLLYSSDFIMDLTLRENCLVCGAYEALALQKPIILSNTEALKDYFTSGCIYTEPGIYQIRDAVLAARDNLSALQRDIEKLNTRRNKTWQRQLDELRVWLQDLCRI